MGSQWNILSWNLAQYSMSEPIRGSFEKFFKAKSGQVVDEHYWNTIAWSSPYKQHLRSIDMLFVGMIVSIYVH